MVDISVVIPTYNRAAQLRRCLAPLLEQTLESERYELIVVDDASSDDTPAILEQFRRVRALRQERNAGPAAARNAGIRAARGTYILFLDDDVVVPQTLLAQHLAAHADFPGAHVAILGTAVWPPGEPMSPVTRYFRNGATEEEDAYLLITDPDDVPYDFFITRHVSVDRSFLLQHGLFDEDFRHAYGEDTELAYRLQRHGLRIVFRRDLRLSHHHRYSYRQLRRHAYVAGEVGYLMVRKHPELGDLSFVDLPWKSRALVWIRRRCTRHVLDPMLEWADRHQWDHPALAWAYSWAFHHHKACGLRDCARAVSATSAGSDSTTADRRALAPIQK